jgi:hypothetical protein
VERPRPWGQGKEIRLASLPAVLLSIPWGMFTQELVRSLFQDDWTNVGSRWPQATSRATDRQSRPKAMPPRFRSLARPLGNQRELGHGRARRPAEHRAPQRVKRR